MKLRTVLAAAALPLLAVPATAWADEGGEEKAGPFDFSAEVGLLSDYRFRGLTYSGKDPEATLTLAVSHESGLYASAWISNTDLGFGTADDVEMDWTAGFSKDVGPITVDVGGIYYTYLNYSSLNYFEVYGSLGTKVGPADVKVGINYAPSQSHIGNRDNTYVYISGSMPVTEKLSAHGTFGFENGAFGNDKKDWVLGLSYDLGSGLTLGADYVDTAHSFTSNGDPTVVASLKFGF